MFVLVVDIGNTYCKKVLMDMISLFLSVNSWRCVFYFFAFVGGILALRDVSGFSLFPCLPIWVLKLFVVFFFHGSVTLFGS